MVVRSRTTTGATSAHIGATHAPPATAATTTTAKAAPPPTAAFARDGGTTKDDAARVAAKPQKRTGLLDFQLALKSGALVVGGVSAGALAVGPEILAQAKHPATAALLAIRAGAIPEFSPLVEVVRADGATATGFLRGVDDQGRAILDGGAGKQVAIPLDEPLRAVRHQLDTDGDLHTALVTVFDARTHVADPFDLGAYAGRTVVVERYDAVHETLAQAAKKGDVFDAAVVVKGASKDGLAVDGGTIAREDWKISRVTLAVPAYSYKKDGQRLGDVARALVPGVAVEVVRGDGKPAIAGTFRGVAQDAAGDDYLVVTAKNGVHHALKDDVLDVRSAATSLPLWTDPTRPSVYST